MWKIPRTNIPSSIRSLVVATTTSGSGPYADAGTSDGVSWTASTDNTILWWRTETPAAVTHLEAPTAMLAGMLEAGGFVFANPDTSAVSVMDMKGDAISNFDITLPLKSLERITVATVRGTRAFLGTSLGGVYTIQYPSDDDVAAPTLSSLPGTTSGEKKTSWLGGLLRGRAQESQSSQQPIRRIECPAAAGILLVISGPSLLQVWKKDCLVYTFTAQETIRAVAWGHCGESRIDCAHVLCGGEPYKIIAVNGGEIMAEYVVTEEAPTGYQPFHALVILDDEYHIFTAACHIVKQSDAANVRNANTTDCVLPMNVISAGGGDVERSLWYFTALEGFCLRRAQKSAFFPTSTALVITTTSLSADARDRFAARFESVRYDSLDAVCVQISKDIVDDLRVHHGNWNRSDLAVEDSQLVAHILSQLESRNSSWDEMYMYLTTTHIWQTLSPATHSRLLRHKETLCILRALRELQNSITFPDVISAVAMRVKAGTPHVAYASHSEMFYACESTPTYMLAALTTGTPNVEVTMHVLDVVVSALMRCRAVLPTSNWTRQRAEFLDPFARLLGVLSDAIATLDDDGGPTSWQAVATRDATATARKDGLTKTMCSALEFYLTQADPLLGSPLITQLFLRTPFVRTPVGYPYGALEFPRGKTPFRLAWIEHAQRIAETHAAYGAVLTIIASCPLGSAPDILQRSRQRIADAIQNLPGFVEYLCKAWQQEGRGFELVSLGETIPEGSAAAALFAAHCKAPGTLDPSLKWLMAADRPDRALTEVAMNGSTTISERAAFLSLAKFAAKGAGHAVPADVEIGLRITRTQQKFFPRLEAPQPLAELIRRLSGGDGDGLVAAAALAQYVPEVDRRITLLEGLLRAGCATDDGMNVVRTLRRGSDATEAQQRAALSSSVVLRMSRECKIVKEWVQAEVASSPHLADVRDVLSILRVAERTF